MVQIHSHLLIMQLDMFQTTFLMLLLPDSILWSPLKSRAILYVFELLAVFCIIAIYDYELNKLITVIIIMLLEYNFEPPNSVSVARITLADKKMVVELVPIFLYIVESVKRMYL